MFYVTDKKAEKVYTSARKQMLISALPPVVTLHLKRFHQVWLPVSEQTAVTCTAFHFNTEHSLNVFYALNLLLLKFHLIEFSLLCLKLLAGY